MIKRAFTEVGMYFYFLPTYTQAKKIIWDGITNDGMRFIDFIPEVLRESTNGTEMKILLKNGSIIQLIGTDNYDAIRGTNPRGCIFSEYAYQNPMAWEVVKPILKVNGGWAVFNTTPNGKNHSYDLDLMARENDAWFTEVLTVSDTGVLTTDQIEEERKEGMTQEMLAQEYYCSYEVGALGSYYSKNIQEAQDRICAVPYEKHILVDCWFDLGRNDCTSIIFTQTVGKEIRIIDCYENNGEDISHYVKTLRERGYEYQTLHLPHDARQKRLEAKNSIEETFREAGYSTKIVPNVNIQIGVQKVRKIFPRLWFDKDKCKPLIRAIENYHKEYDEKAKVFKNQPRHDWSSHYCFCRHTKIFTKRGNIDIVDVKKGDYVFTPLGWSKVLEKQSTGVRAVRGFLSTKATDDHPILSQGGFRPLSELTETSKLWSVFTSMELPTCATQIRQGYGIRDIFAVLRRRMEVIGTCTDVSGNFLRAAFRRVATFTTRTVIAIITILRILRCTLLPSISNYIGERIGVLSSRLPGKLLSMRESLRTYGTGQKRGLSSTNGLERNHGKTKNTTKQPVKDAKRHTRHRSLADLNIAASTVKCQCSDCVEVFSLKTDTGMFIANNVLVSNCDALRYLAVGFAEEVVDTYDLYAQQYTEHGVTPLVNKILQPGYETVNKYKEAAEEFASSR